MLRCKLPKLPQPSTPALAIGAIAATGLIGFSNVPALRLAALAGLSGVGAIAHRRLSNRQTGRVLALAESKFAEDTIAARAAGVAEGRLTERELARAAAQSQASETIARAEHEMRQGFEAIERELAAAIAAKDEALKARDRALSIARQHRDRAAAVESQIAAANAQFAETSSQLALERDRLEIDRRSAQQDLADHLRRIEADRDRAIEQATAASEHAAALESAIQSAESRYQQALEQSLSQQANAYEVKLSKLSAELAQFTAGRDAIARRRAAESKLVELSEVLDRFGPKPVFVAGPEGSGKGTTIASYLRALSDKFGAVVPIVFDPSEDRLWELIGVPATANRALFFSLVESTLKQAKSTRADRTQADKFAQQPPIVFVIDESASLYAGMKQDEINHYQTLLDQLRTRGNKYGLIPIFTAVSEQIQNLKSNGRQILNSGTIAPMIRIWLNGVLDEYCTRFASQVGDDLRDWLAVSEGEYRAAMVTVDGGAKVLIPMKHPSHHAQILGENSPTIPVTGPTICPPPDYWPLAAKILFGASVPTGDTLEPARELVAASYQKPAALSPLASAIFNFAVDANEPVTVNKFKRFGSRFYKGASRLDAAEIDRAIDELVTAEMVLVENRGNGGRAIAVQTVA
jgi:hypothetical protein